MIVETTLMRALLMRTATYMVPGNVAERRVFRGLREKLAAQTQDARQKSGTTWREGGGFAIGDLAQSGREVKLSLDKDALQLLASILNNARWPATLSEAQEEEVFAALEEIEGAMAAIEMRETLSKMTKAQRKQFLEEQGALAQAARTIGEQVDAELDEEDEDA